MSQLIYNKIFSCLVIRMLSKNLPGFKAQGTLMISKQYFSKDSIAILVRAMYAFNYEHNELKQSNPHFCITLDPSSKLSSDESTFYTHMKKLIIDQLHPFHITLSRHQPMFFKELCSEEPFIQKVLTHFAKNTKSFANNVEHVNTDITADTLVATLHVFCLKVAETYEQLLANEKAILQATDNNPINPVRKLRRKQENPTRSEKASHETKRRKEKIGTQQPLPHQNASSALACSNSENRQDVSTYSLNL